MRWNRQTGRVVILIILMLLVAFAVSADYRSVISVNPLGLVTGFIGGAFETRLDEHYGLYIYPSYYLHDVSILHRVLPDLDMWAVTATVGLNYYFEGTAPVGPFLGFGVVGGYLSAEDPLSAQSGAIFGLTLRVGARIHWGAFSIAPAANVRVSQSVIDTSEYRRSTAVFLRSVQYRYALSPGFMF